MKYLAPIPFSKPRVDGRKEAQEAQTPSGSGLRASSRRFSCRTIAAALGVFLATAAGAQEAPIVEVDVDSTYFHPAASGYIQGDTTSASNLVARGLAAFPGNGKLLRLKDLLDQQQEQENQDQNQDQNQDPNQDQQEEQENESEQDPEDNENQDQQDEGDQDPDDQGENDPNQEQDQRPEPPRAEEMSQDEAERLLDAMKQEEENKRLQLRRVYGAPVEVDKDW